MDLPPPPAGSHPAREPAAHSPLPSFPQLSAAGWLATTGASLLLLASIVVVAGNWATIGPEVRFAGLVASLLSVYFAAEWFRDRVPLTAKALATLAPTLTAPVGIAAAATLTQPWPICILIGGVGSVVSTEVQSRRWAQPALKATTVFAAGLAATGVAALTDIPVGVVGAAVAVVYATVGAQRRSVVMSIAVALSPLVQLLQLWDIGDGTIARIGASGPVLAWAAPLGSTIAAGVIAVAAHRRQDMTLIAVSAGALAAGLITGSIDSELAPPIWWALPAAFVIAMELLDAFTPASIWGDAARRALRIVTPPVVVAAAASPALLVIGSADAQNWVITIAANAVAAWAAVAGSARRETAGGVLGALFVAACAATVAVEIAVRTIRLEWTDVALATMFAAVSWLLGRNRDARWRQSSAVLLVGAATISTAAIGLDSSEAALALFGLVIGLTAVAFRRSDAGPLDSAALAASVAQLSLAAFTTPLILSMSIALATAQWTMYLIARYELRLAALTASVSAAALGSTWWTSGTNELVITWLHPYGADGSDLAIGAVSLILVAIGHLLRRRQPVSSWLAYSPGLGMTLAWLIPAQLDVNGMWATVAGISVGILSVGVGGIRRLAAPLVIGTGLLATSILVSAGERLSTAPAWTWIASGGAGLLVLAGMIERTDRPLLVSKPNDDLTSLLDQFRNDFS